MPHNYYARTKNVYIRQARIAVDNIYSYISIHILTFKIQMKIIKAGAL